MRKWVSSFFVSPSCKATDCSGRMKMLRNLIQLCRRLFCAKMAQVIDESPRRTIDFSVPCVLAEIERLKQKKIR